MSELGASSPNPQDIFIKTEIEMEDPDTTETENESPETGSSVLTSILHTEEHIDIDIKLEPPDPEAFLPKPQAIPAAGDDLLVAKSASKATTMVVLPEHVVTDIKTEEDEEAKPLDSIVSYDYPHYSEKLDRAAPSLTEIKSEPDFYPDDNADCLDAEIKIEPEFNVTETHLISNKLINTTSTITRPHDGVTESTTTRTLVMQILPVNSSAMEMADEILPNQSYDNFQLNSITGDELSLEQLRHANIKLDTRHIPCPYCTNMYKSTSSLRRHLMMHESIKRYEEGRKRIVIKKQIDKTEEYECTCGKSFKRRTLMETCLKSHDYEEPSAHYCTTCAKDFDSKDELILHKKRVHLRKRFQCKFCPTEYTTQKELFKHLLLHQQLQITEYKVVSEILEGKELRCCICIKVFTELPELRKHVMTEHRPPYKCECNKIFDKLVEFLTHYKTHADKESVLDALEAYSKLAEHWQCEECNLTFTEADQLAVHRLERHTETKSTEDAYHCEDCRRVFTSAKSLKSHKRIHHSAVSSETDEKSESLKFLCVYCCKICRDQDALTSHLRLHSPERKFVCKFCDFRFATAEKRKAHAEIHTGDLKYVCFICEYQCSSLQRLTNHKQSPKHLSMKEYLLTGVPPEPKKPTAKVKKHKMKEEASECDICGDTFASKRVMLEHKKTHPFISFPNDGEPSRIFFK